MLGDLAGRPGGARARLGRQDVGATNTAITHTFRARRVRTPGPPPAEFELVWPIVVALVPGFPGTPVDCGFPED
ncbi:hypothetical protein SAMN05661080_03603 [Modestobacter sp. DSM 44400]|nr:hypothetical protein SAMN05661080_03603 [Modestobacter sp. DSM 44400]